MTAPWVLLGLAFLAFGVHERSGALIVGSIFFVLVSVWAHRDPALRRHRQVSRDRNFDFPAGHVRVGHPDNELGAAPLTRPTPRLNRKVGSR